MEGCRATHAVHERGPTNTANFPSLEETAIFVVPCASNQVQMKTWFLYLVALAVVVLLVAVPAPVSSATVKGFKAVGKKGVGNPLTSPESQSQEHPLLQRRALPSGVTPTNAPASRFVVLSENEESEESSASKDSKTRPRSRLNLGGVVRRATEWATEEFRLAAGSELRVTSAYQTQGNGVWHVYLRQFLNGEELFNADLNVNLDSKGRILSYGESLFQTDDSLADSTTAESFTGEDISAADAFQALAEHVAASSGSSFASSTFSIESEGEYVEEESSDCDKTEKNSEALFAESSARKPHRRVVVSAGSQKFTALATRGFVHSVSDDSSAKQPVPVWNLEADLGHHWVSAQVDRRDGRVHALADWVSWSHYRVFPIGVNDPEDGERALLKNPEDPAASPRGWHDPAERAPKTTRGNNVWAQANWSGEEEWRNLTRPAANGEAVDPQSNTTTPVFDYPLDLDQEPHEYVEAAVTNLFYWNNVMHDLMFRYGFDEAAGNFQDINFSGKGRGNDAVVANAQDGEGVSG